MHLVGCTIGIYYDARTYEYLKKKKILFHGNQCYANARQYYAIRSLLV